MRLSHLLIMYDRKGAIKSITMNLRQGYYSPLTLSSYLYVNNISTSVFSDRYVQCLTESEMVVNIVYCRYQLPPADLHYIFAPIRGYYRTMRWIHGKNYDPFSTSQKEGLHPLPAFIMHHRNKIWNIYLAVVYIIPAMIISILFHSIQKSVVKRFFSTKRKLA